MVYPEKSSNMVCLHAVARGRVQGVNYRSFVLDKARQLGLRGFVRNLPSYDEVEIQAEGKKEDLDKLLNFIKLGPDSARVDKVDVFWSKPFHNFQDFVIKY